MREIKFKVWHEASKQFFNWDDCALNGRNNCIIQSTEGVFKVGIDVEIDQYTGLKDKNSIEIYEGDILKINTEKLMVVGWSERFASFIINRDGWAFCHWFGESCNPEDCEVVGNIHQNPELLK